MNPTQGHKPLIVVDDYQDKFGTFAILRYMAGNIPGVDKVEADLESWANRRETEWKLNSEIYDRLCKIGWFVV